MFLSSRLFLYIHYSTFLCIFQLKTLRLRKRSPLQFAFKILKIVITRQVTIYFLPNLDQLFFSCLFKKRSCKVYRSLKLRPSTWYCAHTQKKYCSIFRILLLTLLILYIFLSYDPKRWSVSK